MPNHIGAFLEQAEQLCKVRIIDYNSSERAYDNSIFIAPMCGAFQKCWI